MPIQHRVNTERIDMSAQAALEAARARKSELGQFFTPAPVADFMASMFHGPWEYVDLLDAGAGAGSLAAAVVARLCAEPRRPKQIAVTAYELDAKVLGSLRESLILCESACKRVGIEFAAAIHHEDFIASIVPSLRGEFFADPLRRFNLAIVNPPYRKIASDSLERRQLRLAGIETSNLYAAFVALIIRLLAPGGELVSITPRSFCNGPYFKPFRRDFLRRMSLRRIHSFDSRSAAFAGDDVLQENVIVHAVKGETPPRGVMISSSSGAPGSSVRERVVDYERVVRPTDPEQFIHLEATDAEVHAREAMARLPSSLADLGLSVSTGRVVDFRAREFLHRSPGHGDAPLIYPGHFGRSFVEWPKPDLRKPNAITSSTATRDLLVPAGLYPLVKRFTAKEERRRVVACLYDSERIVAPLVGFENHLNYYHADGRGLSRMLAQGLTAFLNSTVVDVYFRGFSGHTQVNATDLRALKYPAKVALERWGSRLQNALPSQSELDDLASELVFQFP